VLKIGFPTILLFYWVEKEEKERKKNEIKED